MGSHLDVSFGEMNIGKNKYFPVLLMRCEGCDRTGFYIPSVNVEAWMREGLEELPEHVREALSPEWMEGYRRGGQ